MGSPAPPGERQMQHGGLVGAGQSFGLGDPILADQEQMASRAREEQPRVLLALD